MEIRNIEIKAEIGQYEQTRQFLVGEMKKLRVQKQIIEESVLVFEEIFLRIIEQYQNEEITISVSLVRRLGEAKILVMFPGERFNIDFHSIEEFNPGAAILSMYEDKIGMSYRKHNNTIGIIVKRTYDRIGYLCMLAIALAIVSYILSDMLFDEESLNRAFDVLIVPGEKMFANAMIMAAAPVTFFSLITNITNCYVIADNRVRLGRLGARVLISSVIAEAFAVVYFLVISAPTRHLYEGKGAVYRLSDNSFLDVFKDTAYDIVPKDIFRPFMDLSPFPMVLISIIAAAALCSMNKHFNTIKGITDAVNALFSKMLYIIMLFLPVAVFLSIFDVLCDDGYLGIMGVAAIILTVIIGEGLMIFLAGAKVAVFGINPVTFLKKCLPVAKENFKINSSIDAVPYNIRFCNKTFGISISSLDVEMPILAQINQTGNSFVLMFMALFVMSYTGIEINVLTIILLAILVTFISIGAPGQGGTVIIGLVIIYSFVGVSYTLVALIIYTEALLGRTLPVLNSFFDIATVVTSDRKYRRKKDKCQQ